MDAIGSRTLLDSVIEGDTPTYGMNQHFVYMSGGVLEALAMFFS